ncbi:transcriptional regulator, TetR family [Kineococcus radiotolerans SRS30216 = ATCC BAA-149]|uniref:Transcriptional regulator, TetR family n=1 Tax=Kineococcus radiotolerans (strain ATCC BAA-149 / DSM 14245 / SRS30216) TaxID=266940 RepID=A6W8B8_KINRD|nr:transcriptional regulator, TetR family [Kineococcus radiotolerans SRS30216 = ATCC BAA-149]
MRTVVRFYSHLQAPVVPTAYAPPVPRPVSLLGSPPVPERADATRNRELLLRTARALLDEHGAAGLSMDALAAAAGLGKGTVFRRFGSRAGLFAALLDEHERDFQAACLWGPPPLGPGADPVDRLVAFGHERLDLLARRGHLVREADAHLTRGANAPAAFARLHVRVLLQAAGVGGDVEVLAFNLLAVLEAPLARHVERAPDGPAQPSPQRLAAGWTDLVRRVVRPGG